ncbi:MAG: transcription repressor NadR [Bacillota bacterium]|nr:transcription repressor NadR [Bacillota bacterium]
MQAEERRKKIIGRLTDSKEAVTGGELATLLNVSRQIIVQDVALLRAKGIDILATPQGYILAEKLKGSTRATIACQHDANGLKRELEIIVAHGGKIIDVTVEHPLYGELQGLLMIKTLKEVENFVKSLEESDAKPLSTLTNGVHIHTVEVDSMEMLQQIKAELNKEGILVT